MAGAEVHVSKGDDGFASFLDPSSSPPAVTAADGFFRIEDRREGETVDLTARHAGYAPGVAPGVRVPPELALRIALSPVAAIEGRTVDPDGRPVPRARVTVRPNERMRFDLETVSDESGFFRIETVVPGSVQLLAGAPGHQSALLKLDVLPGQELRGVEVLLVPGATVEGRILSAAGKPVVNAWVSMEGGWSSGLTISDGEGRYRLEGVPPGTRTIGVRHQDRRRGVHGGRDQYQRAPGDLDVERRRLAGEVGPRVLGRESGLHHTLVARRRPHELFLEAGNESPLSDFEQEALPAAAFERLTVDAADEVGAVLVR